MSRFARNLRRRTADDVRQGIVDEVRDEEAAERRAGFKERKNAYYCETCIRYTVTIDRDEGVTPMFLACRASGHEPDDPANPCKGQSTSMMYPAEPWPSDHPDLADGAPPTWEWYAPDSAERKRLPRDAQGMLDHVERGGLLLRRIDA